MKERHFKSLTPFTFTVEIISSLEKLDCDCGQQDFSQWHELKFYEESLFRFTLPVKTLINQSVLAVQF